MDVLAAISIGMGPNLIQTAGFVLAWHGIFTFVAVAVAVFLAASWGRREGLNADAIYSVSLWAIIGGIVGARVVHVIDFWEIYSSNFMRAFFIWEGGVAIYGAVLGGFVGGGLYIIIRNSDQFLAFWGALRKVLPIFPEPHKAPLPGIGHLADVVAPALLIAMAIGRIGDIINGEHFAKATSLPWGFVYTNSESLGFGRPISHPAVAYELLFDLALAAVIWPLRNRLRPRGMFFVLYGALYSIGRFFLSFLRVESQTYFDFLNQAQVLALIVIVVAVPLLVFRAQIVRPGAKEE
jgi:phosphatidylglycerol:prolipoprotein diacylglycerol transferase